MKKKALMCDPVVEAPEPKRSKIPWISFGLLVIWAAAFSFAIPADGEPGLVTRLALQIIEQWHNTFEHTAQALPRFTRGG